MSERTCIWNSDTLAQYKQEAHMSCRSAWDAYNYLPYDVKFKFHA